MMDKRKKVLIGLAVGLVWSVALLVGTQRAGLPYIPAPIALPGGLFLPGLVLLLMIARVAQRRLFDAALIDGERFAPGSGADIDQRVLSNSIEQVVLAVVIWPYVALTLGGAIVIAMGVSFALGRVAFWVGYHYGPPLRAFGFAATFYPTVLAAIWAVVVWFV